MTPLTPSPKRGRIRERRDDKRDKERSDSEGNGRSRIEGEKRGRERETNYCRNNSLLNVLHSKWENMLSGTHVKSQQVT